MSHCLCQFSEKAKDAAAETSRKYSDKPVPG